MVLMYRGIAYKILSFLSGLVLGVLVVMYFNSSSIDFLPILSTRSLIKENQKLTQETDIDREEEIKDSETLPQDSASNEPETHVELSEQILIKEQVPGVSVNLARINVADDSSWVVVRDYNEGNLGSVLGARRILSGVYQSVEVSLLRSTKSGQTYAVQLYTDNGDNSFNVDTDIPSVNRKISTFLVK